MSKSALPYVFLLGFLFGSNFVSARFAIGQFDPVGYVALRLSLAALGHIGFYLVLKSRPFPRDLRLWFHAGMFGLIGMAITLLGFVISLNYISSGVAGLLQTLIPAITIIMAHFALPDERLTWTKALGVLIAFVGAGLLLAKGETGLADVVVADWRGYAWLGMAIVAAAAGSVYASRFLRDADNFDVASIRIIVASLFVLPFAWIGDGFDFSAVKVSGVIVLAYAVVFGTFITFYLYFYITKRFGATAVAQNSYATPVVTTILGALLLGEQVTQIMIVGMILIFIGLTFLIWQPQQKLSYQVEK